MEALGCFDDEFQPHCAMKLELEPFGGPSGLNITCPLSPDPHDHQEGFWSPLGSSHDSLLASPRLAAHTSLHEASSVLDEALQAAVQQQCETAALDAAQHTAAQAKTVLPLAAPTPATALSFYVSSCSEGDLSTCPSSQLSDDATNRGQKRPKLEWTPALHRQFVEAVESLPADKQVPSRILERMGEAGVGLMRANIASHLQKYRNRKSSSPDLACAHATCAAMALPPAAGLAPGVVMGVPCFPLLQAPAGMLPMLLPVPESLLPAAAAAPAPAGMIPTPAAPLGAADWPAPDFDLSPPDLPVPDTLSRELQEVLTGKRKRGPLGLSLDTAAVARQWNSGRLGGW